MYKLLKFYREGFNPQQYWDDKYAREHIAGKSMDEFPKQEFWPTLKNLLDKDPQKKYLDAGCGVGGWILFLKEEGYNVAGIDIAARTVRAMTEYDRDLEVKIAGMTAIPYGDESFDGVLSIGTLEYIEDNVPQALKEVTRVLKSQGFLFLEVPMANTLRRLLYLPLKKIEQVIKTNQGKTASFSNYLFTRDSIENKLQEAGLELVAMKPHELPDADSHYGLYVDWPFLRGKEPYKLNMIGKLVKMILNGISPWIASTGAVIVAKKK